MNGQIRRGQRVFCSDRGKRGGCGKTFCVFFAAVLPRHSFSAPLLWALLFKLLHGATIKRAAEDLCLPFTLEGIYALIRRLRGRQDTVRSRLYREASAPPGGHADPLLQTIEHLRQVFAPHPGALAAYQLRFQKPFLG